MLVNVHEVKFVLGGGERCIYIYICMYIYISFYLLFCFFFLFIFPKKKTYKYSIVLQLRFLLTDFHI